MDLTPDRPARALPAIAFASAIAGSAFLAVRWTPILLVVALPLTLAIGIPLAFGSRSRFRAACWWVAGSLVLLQIPGVYFGVAVFLPSALILTIAALDRLPARTATAALAAVLVTAGWSAAVYGEFVSDRTMYMVIVPGSVGGTDSKLLLGDGSGIGYGATNVFYSHDRVWVGYPSDLSQADRDALARRLLEVMPPGSRVVRCHGQRC